MENYSAVQKKEEKESSVKRTQNHNYRRCSYCNFIIKKGGFCPNCGENQDIDSRQCSVCGAVTTKTVCPSCLSPMDYESAEQVFEIQKKHLTNTQRHNVQIKRMSVEDVEKIASNVQKEESNILHKIQEIKKHHKLLDEKRFQKEREERMDRVFGKDLFSIRTQQYEREKNIVSSALKLYKPDNEFEKLNEELTEINSYIRQLITQEVSVEFTDDRLEQAIEVVNRDIALAKQKREAEIQEALRKKKDAEEKLKVKINSKICGNFFSIRNCPCGGHNHEDMRLFIKMDSNNNLVAERIYSFDDDCYWRDGYFAGSRYFSSLSVNFNGHTIELTDISAEIQLNPKAISVEDYYHKFSGKYDKNFNILKGIWHTPDSDSRQMTFVRY